MRDEQVAAPEWDVAALERLERELTGRLFGPIVIDAEGDSQPIKPRQAFRERGRRSFTADEIVVVVVAQGLVYAYDLSEPEREVVIPEREFPDSVDLLGWELTLGDVSMLNYQEAWVRKELEILRALKTTALEEVYKAERAREPSLAQLAQILASRKTEAPAPARLSEGADDRPREFDDESAPAYDAALVPIEDGDLVTGQVVGIDQEEVLVDIDLNCVGVIPSTELSILGSVDPADEVSLGEEVDALVLIKEGGDGRPVLSQKRARFEKAWGRIEARPGRGSRSRAQSSACGAAITPSTSEQWAEPCAGRRLTSTTPRAPTSSSARGLRPR